MKNCKEEPQDRLVTIKTFATLWEAHVALGVLNELEIPAMLTNETFSQIYPVGFNTLGEVGLMVYERDAERAREAVAHCSSSGI